MAPKKRSHVRGRRLSFNGEVLKSPRDKLSRHLDLGNHDSGVEVLPETDLSDILKETWTLYVVSPLFNFHQAKLPVYGKKMGDLLTAAYTNDTTFKTVFTIRPNLKRESNDEDGIMVEVISNKDVSVYKGFLLSWDSKVKNDHFTSYPTLLARGHGKIINKIHELLCKLFDCEITPVPMMEYDLVKQLCALLYVLRNNKRSTIHEKVLTLQYKIPGCPLQDRINVLLSVEDIFPVITLFMEHFVADPNISDKELCEGFYSSIMKHVELLYSFNLFRANLYRIILPTCAVSLDGKIRWNCSEAAKASLVVLQNKCKKFLFLGQGLFFVQPERLSIDTHHAADDTSS